MGEITEGARNRGYSMDRVQHEVGQTCAKSNDASTAG